MRIEECQSPRTLGTVENVHPRGQRARNVQLATSVQLLPSLNAPQICILPTAYPVVATPEGLQIYPTTSPIQLIQIPPEGSSSVQIIQQTQDASMSWDTTKTSPPDNCSIKDTEDNDEKCKQDGEHQTKQIIPSEKLVAKNKDEQGKIDPYCQEEFQRNEFYSHRRAKFKRFDEGFEELLKFKETYGHCNAPSYFHSVGTFCQQLRRKYHRPLDKSSGARLSTDQIKKLEDIGFEWTINRVTSARLPRRQKKRKPFDEHFIDLMNFKKRFGHCDVPTRDPLLGVWCQKLRKKYHQPHGRTALTKEQIRRLEEIGFRWNAKRKRAT